MATSRQADPKQTDPQQTATQRDPEPPDHDNDRGETQDPEAPMGEQVLAETVGEKAQRRLAAQDKEGRSLWFGMGAFGVIGWSIAIPTLIGTALGLWLDNTWADPFSWTLALLLAGVAVGIFNAWYWMSSEQRAMEAEQKQRMPVRGQGAAGPSTHRDGTKDSEGTDA